jgi:hypothetical protein
MLLNALKPDCSNEPAVAAALDVIRLVESLFLNIKTIIKFKKTLLLLLLSLLWSPL